MNLPLVIYLTRYVNHIFHLHFLKKKNLLYTLVLQFFCCFSVIKNAWIVATKNPVSLWTCMCAGQRPSVFLRSDRSLQHLSKGIKAASCGAGRHGVPVNGWTCEQQVLMALEASLRRELSLSASHPSSMCCLRPVTPWQSVWCKHGTAGLCLPALHLLCVFACVRLWATYWPFMAVPDWFCTLPGVISQEGRWCGMQLRPQRPGESAGAAGTRMEAICVLLVGEYCFWHEVENSSFRSIGMAWLAASYRDVVPIAGAWKK